MPFAARIGDLTSHGTPLAPGPGSFNVLIGGQPAWRVGSDVHACPLVTALVPHVGGVVAVGSFTVLINGLPAAPTGRYDRRGGTAERHSNGMPHRDYRVKWIEQT